MNDPYLIYEMLAFFSLLFFGLSDATSLHATPYVPGQPGAAWSEDEILIVKAKLYSGFNAGKAIYIRLAKIPHIHIEI